MSMEKVYNPSQWAMNMSRDRQNHHNLMTGANIPDHLKFKMGDKVFCYWENPEVPKRCGIITTISPSLSYVVRLVRL